ncbi:helix-turn-helix domain-containing protein, partial [Streptomyces virginiae]
MPTEDELFAAVDALLTGEPEMPPPAERARLREAAGITQARLAQVLQTTTQSVKNWEAGRSEPRPPRRQAYQRLLDGWATQHSTRPNPPIPAALAGTPAPATPSAEPVSPAVAEVPVRPVATSRRPTAKKAAKPTTPADPRFPH